MIDIGEIEDKTIGIHLLRAFVGLLFFSSILGFLIIVDEIVEIVPPEIFDMLGSFLAILVIGYVTGYFILDSVEIRSEKGG